MRYIDADALHNSFREWFKSYDWDENEIEKHTIATAIRTVDSQPTADVREVVRGEWEVIDYAEPRRYVCSICHIGLGWHTTNYCPNCGAEMRGEQDDRN